jgi:flagella basal body P-ring formation protein FlgA
LAYANTLEKKYEIKGDKFYAKTIIPKIKNDFLIADLSRKNRLKISARKLQNLFKKHNIDIKVIFPVVEIVKKSSFNIEPLKSEIRKKYINFYENISIKEIKIKPNGYFNQQNMTLEEIIFSKNNLLKNKGSFSAYFKNQKRKKKVFFKFEIDAFIKVLKTTKDIKKNSILNHFNTTSQTIHFIRFSSKPLSLSKRDLVQLKRYIKKDKIILANMVKNIPAIMKNQKVKAVFTDGAVSITIFATATQDGDIGDKITIKTDDGKKYKALIVDKNHLVISQ